MKDKGLPAEREEEGATHLQRLLCTTGSTHGFFPSWPPTSSARASRAASCSLTRAPVLRRPPLPLTSRLRERREERGRVAPGPLLVQPAGHRAEEPPLFVDECHSPGWGGGDAPEGRSVVRLGRHDEQAVPLLGRAGVDVDPAVGRGRPPTKDGEDWGASVSRPGGRRAPALPSLPCSGRPSAPRQSSLRYDRRVRGPCRGWRPRMTRRLPRRLGVHGTRLGLVRAHVLLRLVGRLRVQLRRTSAGRRRRRGASSKALLNFPWRAA